MLEFKNNALHHQPQIVKSLSVNSSRAPLYVTDRDPDKEKSLSRANGLSQTTERSASYTIGVQGGLSTNCDPAECNNRSTDQTVLAKSLLAPGRTRSLLRCLFDAEETGHGVMTIDTAKPWTCRDFWSASSKRKYEASNGKWLERDYKRLCASNREVGIPECPAAEYCSGDSDLTAERMAEGGSRTSSVEDGCTLALEGVSERGSKESIDRERRQGHTGQVRVARGGSVDRDCRRKRELITPGYRGEEERPFLLPIVTGPEGNADEGYQGEMISRNPMENANATIASRVHVAERKQLQLIDESEDDWLQLGLGRTIPNQSKLANSSGPETTSSRVQPQKLALLEFLPQKPDREAITVRATPANLNEEHLAQERGKHFPCPAPLTATVRRDAGEGSPRMTSGSFMEYRDHVDPLFHRRSPSYSSLRAGSCDLPIQISSCVPLLSGPQLPFIWQDDIERYADHMHRDRELSGYAPGSYYPPTSNSIFAPPPTSIEGTSNKGTRYQDPLFPEAAGGSRFEKWQLRPSGKASPTWASFHDALANRIPRNSAGPSHCALDLEMPVQHHISAATAPGHLGLGLEEWTRIMDRFSTNLRFQKLDRGSSIDIGAAGLIPSHEITTQVHRVIDRCNFNKFGEPNDKNLMGFRTSWSELSGTRMLPLCSDPNIGERGHCERPFHSLSPLSITANIGANLIEQQPFPQSFNGMKRITKTRRGPQGFWFSLQAKEFQCNGRLLPQIPRAYIRIKDGVTPISAVKKYLVAKLGLSNESEVEITCRGKTLPNDATLANVRDEIWFPVASNEGEALSFSSAGGVPSSSEELVMILTYGSSQHIQ